jgi:hypothetical protein
LAEEKAVVVLAAVSYARETGNLKCLTQRKKISRI